MMKLHASDHKVDLLFVLALFTMFAATAFLVVLIGAKQYQITADNMDYNYEVRTTSSYLQEKLRQSDTGADIYVTTIDGTSVLAITEKGTETDYCTYIYCYDGHLRELFVRADATFDLSAGQSLLEVQDFSAKLQSKDLLVTTFTGTDGVTYPIYSVIHTASGKEAP